MSAAAAPVPAVDRDLGRLAPRFRAGVEAALAACATAGLDATVFEACRSNALQAAYYARGRTVVPPHAPVTNARTALYSWHGYGLAVDVVSRAHLWQPPEGLAWFRKVAAIFKAHGCAWGGEWQAPDPPHFQWGACKPSPSDRARAIKASEGDLGVWRAVGAG